MGGINEEVVEKKKSNVASPVGDIITPTDKRSLVEQTQAIRVHRTNNGTEVHFHVDDEKLKVAIPISVWMGMESRLLAMETCEFFDAKNKSTVTILPRMNGKQFDLIVSVQRAEVTANTQKILNLTKR